MANRDPNALVFSALLKITYPTGTQLFTRETISASNWKQAHKNAVNYFKKRYPNCTVEVA